VEQQITKYVDIHKVFKDKNPKLYKWVPNFFIEYIRNVIHEDEINIFQTLNENVFGFEYCDAAIKEIGITVSHTGLEHVPATGQFIAASNHSLGGADGMALIKTIGLARQDIHCIVNDLLANLKNFGNLFVPVNKYGATSGENLRRIEALFASQNGTLIFPAGLVSRRVKGVVQDLEWNKSFIVKSQKYNSPVLPVHASGQLSNWFLGLSNFRKTLGIKMPIEMIYLVNEMYKQRGNDIKITIGQAIPASTFTKDKKPQEWATLVRNYIYELAKNPSLKFTDTLK
jgi:putative hemolysin